MTVARFASFVAGSVFLASGCSSLEPGESRYSGFLTATLTSVEGAPYGETVKATMQAMKELNLDPMQRDADGFRSFIVGETVMGQLSQTHEVRVWVTRLTEATSRIEIRILGRRDKERLEAILGEIRSRLGKKAT